ncbi:nitrate/nitrite transporter [Herbiconiux sp. L3-i23]|uniref:MFS transporter n=1 Tax=Herbiconiux sp. L3-i23 TaxID=2905871 RepID=UPI00204CE584|nr:MFS transporter [Herbiconiux sp. L3-i23]BDI22891.1 MFS transporter [Herbiconiux sp. L3-i23]
MNSRRHWIIFAIGVVAYVTAVMQRSSLGVAGVEASERFSSSAAALSTLGVLQLIVYAGLQIPVGVLVDRLGPKALVASGAALMAIGQVVVALAPDLVGAVVGRVLVGAGDAATFISVLRLVNTWFAGRNVPVVTQWLTNLGQFGQVLSAIPFAIVLHAAGWEPAFLSAASVAVFSFVLVVALLSNGRGVHEAAAGAPDFRSALVALGESFRRPGTQLGFWAHFVTQAPGTVFALFWGVPFMVFGVGLDPAFASAMIAGMVVVAILVGPLLGFLMVRYPLRRSSLALLVVVIMAVAWGAVLLWPAPIPAWLIVLLVIAISIGGPASQIGFDFARTFNPARRLGSANGIVNVGGFTASFVIMQLVGVLLDLQHPGATAPSELYALDSFRLAMLVQFPIIGFGVIMLVRARHRTRRLMLDEEGISVGPLWVALFGKLRSRRSR